MPGNYVLLEVADDGSGMDKTILASVFEPFFTTKPVGKGTGLGLSTVYGIVKQNQGFINVDSEPGRGTHFRIYLPPYHGNAIEKADKTQVKTPRGRGETILIVEDEASLLRLATVILERLGYKVLGTESPGKALQIARKHPGEIHLLLADVVLPEMSGSELAEALIKIRSNTRILFMSGYTSDVIKGHDAPEKGFHFIQKPFTSESLARKVGKVLH